jgi:hypothetical protein
MGYGLRPLRGRGPGAGGWCTFGNVVCVIGPCVWGVVHAPDGAGWDSPGQRLGSWAHPIPTALKGRHGCARHFAPSGRRPGRMENPGRCPGLFPRAPAGPRTSCRRMVYVWECRMGTSCVDVVCVIGSRVWGVVQAPDGAGWDSPGQRPGSWAHPIPTALKGRHGCARHSAPSVSKSRNQGNAKAALRVALEACQGASMRDVPGDSVQPFIR